jgi:hypothetical protein
MVPGVDIPMLHRRQNSSFSRSLKLWSQLRVNFRGLEPIGLSLPRSGSTLRVNLDPGSTAALFRAPGS